MAAGRSERLSHKGSIKRRSEFAEIISSAYKRTVGDVFEIGDLLLAAKDSLPHGEYTKMIRADLPFSPRMARNYTGVAKKEILRKRKHVAVLPQAVGTLVELVRIDNDLLEAAFAAGDITPQLTRSGARMLAYRYGNEDEHSVDLNCTDIQLISGDMGVLNDELEDESISLLFTDPPYGQEHLDLYGRLSMLASAKLKSDGVCLVYVGKYYLPEILEKLTSNLHYRWLFSFNFARPKPVYGRRLSSKWRPIVMLQREPGVIDHNWLQDLLPSGEREKSLHEWQQSLPTARYCVEKFTDPGELVVDPFTGSATTGVACVELGRRFVGTERDPSTAAVARRRISEVIGREDLQIADVEETAGG